MLTEIRIWFAFGWSRAERVKFSPRMCVCVCAGRAHDGDGSPLPTLPLERHHERHPGRPSGGADITQVGLLAHTFAQSSETHTHTHTLVQQLTERCDPSCQAMFIQLGFLCDVCLHWRDSDEFLWNVVVVSVKCKDGLWLFSHQYGGV